MSGSRSNLTLAPGRYQSFTTASLLLTESRVLAALHGELHDWDAVRSRALVDNLVQARTSGTRARIVNEVTSRLRLLGDRELHVLNQGSLPEQASVLWVAVCRRYPLIRDFALEVMQPRYRELRLVLTAEDFDTFFNRKAEWHPELERMAASTRKRLRPALFHMMRQAGLLVGESTLAPANLGPRLVAAISEHDRQDLSLFPTSERG